MCSKKKGGYVVFQIDKDYEPAEVESREIFGITVKQKRNNLKIGDELLTKVVTKNKDVNFPIGMVIQSYFTKMLDSLDQFCLLTLKYTQSNSICVVNDGHVIGIGSGQQSRILCSTLALSKANVWYQKSQIDYSFLNEQQGLKRTDIDQLIESKRQEQFGDKIMLNGLRGTCLLSDGFFPQKDNIELANQYGIKYIATPMGSIRDNEIIETADKYGITIINTGTRLFHH